MTHMLKPSKIFLKENKNKLKDCVSQLKNMKETYKLGNITKDDIVYEEPTYIENVLNSNVKNAWGQRDPNSLLKERNDRIIKLEAELEELRLLSRSLEQEQKKVKLNNDELLAQEAYDKILKEKDHQLVSKQLEIDELSRKIIDLEAQLNSEKSNLEALKESNTSLLDTINKKQNNYIKRDYMANIKNYLPNDEEFKKLQNTNEQLKKELFLISSSHQSCESTIAQLKAMLQDMETKSKFKNFTKDIVTNDIETELLEEIDNISAAYDKILKTNTALEKDIEEINKKVSTLSAEKALLSNKLEILEESKLYNEKERNRLGDWKEALFRETQIFAEKIVELENVISEKDAKIAEYKTSVNQFHNINRQVSNELFVTSNSFKQLKKDYDTMAKEMAVLKVDNESYLRNYELYKRFCTVDTDVLEEIDSYRKALKCVLCDSNLKNCTLIKCGHTFCESCINDRLRARQRKCPNCQVEFSSNDIKKIYF